MRTVLLDCTMLSYKHTYSFVISSGFGGVTGLGPVTAGTPLAGVCLPFAGAPLAAGAAPFFPPPAGWVF